MGIRRLVTIPVVNTDVYSVIMRRCIDNNNCAGGYAENLASGGGPHIHALVAGQAKLGVILGIRAEVLCDFAMFCRPCEEFK